MNLEPEFTAKPQEGEGGLFSLAILSHLAGAVAGLIRGIFRLSLDQADRFRDALIAWAHGEKRSLWVRRRGTEPHKRRETTN